MIEQFRAFIELIRPYNVALSMTSIGIGALLTGLFSPVSTLIYAGLSGGFICAAGNAINDYFDWQIDKINKPNRPLPSGRITRVQSFVFSMTLFLIGNIVGFTINFVMFSIALSASLLLFVYSSMLKSTVLWGNITVSLVSGLDFIYGGSAVGRIKEVIIPAIFAFLFHLGREIIKDLEDIKGDSKYLAVTLPVRYGMKVSLCVVTIVFLVLVWATILPYFLGIYNLWYLVIVIIGVDFFLVYVIISLWKHPFRKNFHLLGKLLKYDMIIGLFALFVGLSR